jgi:type IV pilus assembly protein PilX
MNSCTPIARRSQRGVVLVSSLLLLIVVTIIALSMFRSFGIQEKIAGNMREKQRALQAAISAEVYAEAWLQVNGGAGVSEVVDCAGLLSANIGQGQICANLLTAVPGGVADVTQPPWVLGGNPVGVTFAPVGMPLGATTAYSAPTAAGPNFFATPTFYISDLGTSIDPTVPGEIYQIDAYAYGGSQNTVAVVESTYAVYTSSSNRTL